MKKSLSLLGYSATLLFNFSVMLTASANADSTINPIGSSAFEEAAGPAVEPYADVVFVDKYLPELTELLNRYAGADVILIDHKSDGLQQIAQALAHRTNINSIHILSHGKPGEINLGRAPIDISSLGRHASGDFALIRSALAEDADILLYGCNVAFGDSGMQFVRQLAAVTDADIAASDDLTGALKHGANWELEISHGSIETTAMNLFAFNGVLGDTDGDTIDDFEDVDDDNDGILDSDERPSVAFAQTFPTSGGNTEFVSGWTVGGTYPSTGPWVSAGRVHLGSNGLTFMRDTDSITTFSRPFSGLTGPQISIYGVRWNNAANGDDTTDTHATMTVSYDGTDYLIIDLSPSQTPSVTALNGASVNTSVLETLIQAIDGASVFSDPKDLMLTLPDTAPSAGDLRFTFTAGPNLSEVRDIAFTGIDILNSRDTDGDAIFDHLDLDSDNDGISDLKESRFGALDADNNGVVDGIATGDSNNDGHLDSLVGKNLTDTDFDTFFDTVDLDSDGDGIADTLEANATVNGNLGAAYDAVTDLVSNHSFSSGDTGWTLIEGSGDATLPSASSGRMYFNSSDLPAGDAVEQSITTSAGLYYLITFELEETGTGSSSHTMLIELLDASSNVLASSSRTVENGGVVQDSLHFQAVGTATTVRFTNTFTENSVDSDLYLDYASVRAVGNDADSDGVSGLFDNDSVFGGSDLLDPLDTDSASIPDYIDLDSDNDGLGDASESGLTPGSDSNGDGIGDALGVSYADTDGTVDPATINAYRDNGLSTAILAEVLEDSSSPGGANNSNASLVTATELGSINGVTNVDLANESLYQSLIQDTTTFSNPPTAAEVQNIIDAVNASEIAIAEVLEDSDARGGTNNANATAVTASQLSEIIGISNVFAAHEVAYQTVIFATATFSDPPTVSEIQSIIDTVNSSEFAIAEVLEDSSSAGGGGNGNATAVTAAQLGAIAGIANVDPANELAYQSLISATTSFANPPTVAQIQTVIDLVNASELAIAEVLEDSDSRGGANNSNAVPVTSTQLAAIIGVTNVDSANELAYQSKIALTAGFSDPPLASEIQSLIDTVNASEYALIEVLEDSDSVGGENNGNSVLVTATQLAAIDGIVNVVSANEDSYQAVILSTTTFSDPPTVAEVQSIVDLVNLSETAIAEVLEDSSSIGGANNSNAVAVTASQLNNIVGITAVDLDNETPYQAMIAGTSTFANPPSLIEVQLIIDTVNASEEGIAEVLEDSGSTGGGANVNGTAVTATQLAAISGIVSVVSGNETAYQAMIALTSNFSNPPTTAEIQTIIDAVNASESAIAELLEDSVSTGGAGNSNAVAVTAVQLSEIAGISNVQVVNEAAYQALIFSTTTFSNPPTTAEIQLIIDGTNASEIVITEVQEDSSSTGGSNNANAVAVTAAQLATVSGVVNVLASNEAIYQQEIAATTTFSNPPTAAEIQMIVDAVNASEFAIFEVLEDSSSPGGYLNANNARVTAAQLADIFGIVNVNPVNETVYQSLIATTATFSNPPSLSEIQSIIDTSNASVSAIAEVQEDSVSTGGAGNSNSVSVTVGQLASIIGIVQVNVSYQAAYQAQIEATSSFSNPPTVAEIQIVIDTTNASESAIAELIEDSSSAGGAGNGNGIAVTALQLASIAGITNVSASNESAYQDLIVTITTFSNPPTVAEIQAVIDDANYSEVVIAEVLEDSSSPGGGGNGNSTAVTASQLSAITGINNVVLANEAVYQQEISATTSFGSPPSAAEIQSIIDTVNASELALGEVLEDSVSVGGMGNANTLAVTALQLADIIGVGNVLLANESGYQVQIEASTTFSNPPTATQVQLIVDAVNQSEAVKAEVLEDSSSAGGANNSNGIFSTASDLADVIGISNVVPANEDAYQSMIASNATFTNPPSVAEIQTVIDAVNSSESAILEVQEDSISAGGAANGNLLKITTAQLLAITGLQDVETSHELAYQSMIAATSTFSNPPTLVQIQDIVDRVNASEFAIIEVLEDSISAGGSSNANLVGVTSLQLSAITGITDVDPTNEVAYQQKIAVTASFSTPPSVAEIQAVVNSVNASEFAINEVLEDSISFAGSANANQSLISVVELAAISGISNVNPANESKYQEMIAATSSFSNPPTLMEIQSLVNQVNFSELVIAEVLEDSASAGGNGNGNGISVTAAELALITGISEVDAANESGYQLIIHETQTFSNPPAVSEIQAVIDTVNNSESALLEILEDSNSIAGSNNSNEMKVSTAQLYAVLGLSDVNPDNESAYQNEIAVTATFSNKPTLAQVQVVVDKVNLSELSISEVLEDSISVTGGNNDNAVAVTIPELEAIIGLVDVNPAYELSYQQVISSTSTFDDRPTLSQIQEIIDTVNTSEAVLAEVLEDSTSVGGADNNNDLLVTAAELTAIVGIVNVDLANEMAYQSVIVITSTFDNPPAVSQIQAIVDMVNASESSVLEVLEDSVAPGGSGNGNEMSVTAIQLSNIAGIRDVVLANESAYQALIAQTSTFSTPPTLEEIQILIDAANTSQAVIAEVLEDSVSAGGSANDNNLSVTANQLSAITGITGVIPENEAAYQTAISVSASLSSPPDINEIQSIIDTVNATQATLEEILEDSLSEAGSANNNGLSVSVSQLSALPGITHIEPAAESVYQSMIASSTTFSDPPTIAEIQVIINEVNNSETALAEALEDSLSVGGSGNINGSFVTAAQLASIIGVDGVNFTYEAAYQLRIAEATDLSTPPDASEIQMLIDSVNTSYDADGDGVPDVIEMEQGTLISEADSYQDSDADGVPDAVELADETDPLDASSYSDTDGGGAPDYVETTLLIPSTDPNDAADDYLDSDTDGAPDYIEELAETDILDAESKPVDTDGDGVSDVQESLQGSDAQDPVNVLDTDGDGIPDAVEGTNDSDQDGVPDYLDLDSDNDGLSDSYESNQNSVNNADLFNDFVAVLTLPDFDGDGIADFLDRDSDNDGIPDVIEEIGVAVDPGWSGVIDNFVDSDGNGLDDSVQAFPVVPQDSDSDGHPNHLDLDSDDDGITDLVEVGGIDVDNDGMIDMAADSDSDGIPDSADYDVVQLADADGDGIDDSVDVSFIDSAVDIDADGIADRFDADTDGDGYFPRFAPDGQQIIPAFIDADGNGEPDVYQADPDLGSAEAGISVGNGGGCTVGRSSDSTLPLLLMVSMMYLMSRRRKPILVTNKKQA